MLNRILDNRYTVLEHIGGGGTADGRERMVRRGGHARRRGVGEAVELVTAFGRSGPRGPGAMADLPKGG